MRKRNFLLIVLLFGFLMPYFISAQELIVEPYTSNSQYLNAIIVADTNANGTRAHTIYVLRRDGLYLINDVIRNDDGWPLNIKAENGTGMRPVIMFANREGLTTNPGYFTQNSGDVWLQNLIINTFIESDPTQKGLMNNMIGTAAAGTHIAIDSCIMMNVTGQFIRTNSAAVTIKMTNSVFCDMGYEGTSNFGAGKGIDLRDGSCDTLLIQNCTFVNVQDRIVRHYNSSATLNHFIFDHNTIVNSMAYHGMLSLGWVGAEVKVTNNLFIDPFAAMADTDYTRQLEFKTNETDPWGGSRMTWIFTDTSGNASGNSTVYTVSHNYYAISDSGQAFYSRWASGTPPFPSEYSAQPEGSPLTWFINSKLGTDSAAAFTKDNNIVLGNTPLLMTKLMDWYRMPASLGGAEKTKATGNYTEDVDMDRRTYEYFSDTLDCTYSTGLAAYTGAIGGFPAGDLNWFPSKKNDWLTPIESIKTVPSTFSLGQNYPNPFNPSTIISFNLAKTGFTTLTVYNILGQKVSTLLSEQMSAGRHEITFDASNLASGVYFYRLESGNNFMLKKMVLLK